ncbi:MAG: hypothetical protein J0I69_13600 [Altererythrobacter sp.]|nr:hypothetical protein [Altererythrobacter sp.]OJU59149.1 MAG: hypothetical protein BGO08_05740 [Altererythrobacter sp. 66-12]
MVKPGDLYEAIGDDEAYAQLPAMAAELIGARSGNIQHMTRAGSIADQHFSYFDSTMVHDYAARFSGELDIWTQAGLASGIVNRAIPVDSLVSEEAFRASPMWNDFFRFHGDDTGHSIGLVHRFDGTTMATSFHRAWSAGPFSRLEAARLDAISTDLHRIYRARDLIGGHAEKSARLAGMLDAHQDCVLLVDAKLRLVEASPSAMQVLLAGDGVALRQGHFTVTDLAVLRGIRQAVANTVNRHANARATFLASRPSGKAPWRIMVLPSVDVGHCCLLLSPSERDAARQASWMRESYSLTRAETGIGLQLLAGWTVEDIASTRSTSVATVRTHVRHILEKTGAHRIAGFIALFGSLP